MFAYFNTLENHRKIRLPFMKAKFVGKYFHILIKQILYCIDFHCIVCTIYNMSGRVVSDIQTRAEGESLYIRYNTDANVVNGLKNDSSYEFIGEVILKINMV
jgi:hypothetical protein